MVSSVALTLLWLLSLTALHAHARPVAAAAGGRRRITLVTILEDHGPIVQPHTSPSPRTTSSSAYLSYLLHSASLQSATLDLVLLNLHDDCYESSIALPSNVRQMCMSPDDVRDRLADLLCAEDDGWSCTQSDFVALHERLRSLQATHTTGSSVIFKPLLSMLLKDAVSTEYFGWIKPDTILGDLGRHIPFDILPDYDIVSFATSPNEAIHLHEDFALLRKSTIQRRWKELNNLSAVQDFLSLSDGSYSDAEFWTSRLLGPQQASDKVQKEINWLSVTRGLQYAVKPTEHASRSATSAHAEESFIMSQGSINGVSLSSLPAEVRRLSLSSLVDSGKPVNTFTHLGTEASLGYRLSVSQSCDLPASFPPNAPRLCPIASSTRVNDFRTYFLRRNGKYLERREPLSAEDSYLWNHGVAVLRLRDLNLPPHSQTHLLEERASYIIDRQGIRQWKTPLQAQPGLVMQHEHDL